jgi:hypothetical protein
METRRSYINECIKSHTHSFSVQLLDKAAGQKPQLTALELTLLSISVAAAASGPWLVGGKLTEFLAPAAAACKL